MVQPLSVDDMREMEVLNRRRTARARDVCGLAGLASVVAGVSLLSVPWALIVGGAALLGLSIWGALRSDQSTARNSERG